MSSVSDYTLDNQSFANLRSELNNILAAVNTLNSATSAPASKVAGSLWLVVCGEAGRIFQLLHRNGASLGLQNTTSIINSRCVDLILLLNILVANFENLNFLKNLFPDLLRKIFLVY